MSEQPKRIQRSRQKGWRMPENAVYVGRPTEFGNPAKISGPWTESSGPHVGRKRWLVEFGAECAFRDTKAEVRALAVEAYRKWLAEPEQQRLRSWVSLLRGKDLACWCPLDQPCHADVLLDLANATADQDTGI